MSKGEKSGVAHNKIGRNKISYTCRPICSNIVAPAPRPYERRLGRAKTSRAGKSREGESPPAGEEGRNEATLRISTIFDVVACAGLHQYSNSSTNDIYRFSLHSSKRNSPTFSPAIVCPSARPRVRCRSASGRREISHKSRLLTTELCRPENNLNNSKLKL